MADLPSGTVTFLFTDIEGSTPLWEQHPQAMSAAVARHHAILREAIKAHHGRVFNIAGDAFCSAFATANDALAAAIDAQVALHEADWVQTPIHVRMGLHTGEAEAAEGDYRSGPTLNRVARVMSIAHGGQILLSQITAGLVRRQLQDGVSLRDLGEHRLSGLAELERVLQVVVPDLPSDFPPLKSLSTVTNNVPVQLTSFIGREKEIAEVQRLLTTTRLLTLIGSGGTGKTRLSLEVASGLFDHFPDGVWFVELAALVDPAHVPQTVASALGPREEPGRPILATLLDYLRNKTVLLVLDNCEHLIEACAKFADALLHAAPRVRILASSREALGIAGETSFLVPSLTTPDRHALPPPDALARYEAVRLFMERATTARPDFALSEQNAAAVGRICNRLDGIPLAIELAAARIKTLSPDEIAARLADRFRLLSSGSRTALPRHQTLRAAIDWSYGLLTEREQTLFRRLAVFAGGWTIDLAEDVCGGDPPAGSAVAGLDVLECLSQLAGKSLVQAEPQARETRYRMLETIRLYARERLVDAAEFEQLERRHFAAFARLAAAAEPRLKGPEQLSWLSRLEAEHDNLRAALACDAAEVSARLQLAINLSWFWNLHSHLSEGRRWLGDLLEAHAAGQPAPAGASLRAAALLAAGSLAHAHDDYPAARSLLEPAIIQFREADDRRGLASALNYLGISAYWQGRKEEARAALQESTGLFRSIGDSWGLALSLHNCDLLAFDDHDLATVQRLNEESQALLRQTGDRWALTMPLGSLGLVALRQGDLRLGEKYLLESLSIQREFADRQGVAWTQGVLASVALRSGDYARAEALSSESLALYRGLNNQGIMIGVELLTLGQVALHRSDHAPAAAHFAEALAIFRANDAKPHAADALRALGSLSLAQGDLARAQSYYGEALQTLRTVGLRTPVAFSLQDFATLAARQHQAETATKLFAASQGSNEHVRELLYPLDMAAHDHALHQLQALLGPRFDELWAEGLALPLEEALALCERVATAPAIMSPLPETAGLTAREVEILRLVAQGLTDPQIAQRLVISTRTVNAHLRSIYDKLDVTTRTAAATFALQNKIV